MTLGQATGLGLTEPHYALTSDLARLCLPQTFQDANKKLAWINSICFLFLLIGLVGLRQPPIIVKPLTAVVETAPVEYIPPDEQTPGETQPKPEEFEPPPDTVSDAPVIATVVAADPTKVAFAVPVRGAVTKVSDARFAAAPPAQPQPVAPVPKPTTFNPKAATGGRYPDPSYPRAELLERHQGKIMLYAVVDASGAPASVTIRDSCGWPTLDRHAAEWVKNNWRWVPGETRHYLVPVIFQIR